MLKLIIVSVIIGAMIGYPIGKIFIEPAIARRQIQEIQNEIFMQKLETLATKGVSLTPEK